MHPCSPYAHRAWLTLLEKVTFLFLCLEGSLLKCLLLLLDLCSEAALTSWQVLGF